jgi:hypothetical protein
MNESALAARLAPALLLMRLGVGLVFAIWTLDKFVNPDHTVRVFSHFYMIPFLTNAAGPTAWSSGCMPCLR